MGGLKAPIFEQVGQVYSGDVGQFYSGDNNNELVVHIVTPPVTHSGHLDSAYRCNIEDIEDWQLRDNNGKIQGGFSQRAMFAIARRDGVRLPKELLQHESEYVDV